jgi:hypothetical protein
MCLNYGQQNNAACGTGGSICQACASGSCQNGVCQGCGPTTCPQGCCLQGVVCLPPGQQNNAACGTGGSICQACASGSCQNGSCSATCNASNCLQGCCSGTACTPYASQSASKCGTNAMVCQSCGYGTSCVNGQCLAASKVTVVSAIVTEKASGAWDGSGATSGPAPDPFVILTVSSTGKTGKTKYVDDTFTPSFNEQVLIEGEQALVIGLAIQVREDDGIWPSELIGTCSAPNIALATVQGGQAIINQCVGNVTQVVLSFSK